MNDSAKRRIGRPSIISSEVLWKLRAAFLMGFSDQEACVYSKIAPSTLYEYQKFHPEFSEQKRAWKLNPILKARATVYDNLDKVKVAMWYLERKCPEEFSLKAPIRHQQAADIEVVLTYLEAPDLSNSSSSSNSLLDNLTPSTIALPKE